MLPFTFNQSDDVPLRLLCLGAHCDDVEIAAGGTLLSLAAEMGRAGKGPGGGLHVEWVVFSGNDEREAEARAAADAFLADVPEASRHVTVHRFRESFFPSVAAEIKPVFEQLKGRGPFDVIFTHHGADGRGGGDRHQDHRVVSELTWNTFRDHVILEYENPKYDADLGQPNVFVPISPDLAQRKIDLLLEHFPSQAKRAAWYDQETFRAMLRLRGLECNSPTRYAEAFHARKLVWGPPV